MTSPADVNAAVQVTASSDSRKIRILVADDHQPILDRVAALLSEDFTVVAAVSAGDDAVGAAYQLHPDVLVLDISMPGLNGFEAARQVKDTGSTAVVIFLSVHDEPSSWTPRGRPAHWATCASHISVRTWFPPYARRSRADASYLPRSINAAFHRHLPPSSQLAVSA